MRRHISLVTLIIIILIFGCVQGPDLDAEKEAIRNAATAQYEAANRGGSEGAQGYASFATEDAIWMPNDGEKVVGREAIAEFALPATSSQDFKARWDFPDVIVAKSGDIAYSIGTFQTESRNSSGNLQRVEGKVVDVWHKQPDGTWQIAVAIWNHNEPTIPEEANTLD